MGISCLHSGIFDEFPKWIFSNHWGSFGDCCRSFELQQKTFYELIHGFVYSHGAAFRKTAIIKTHTSSSPYQNYGKNLFYRPFTKKQGMHLHFLLFCFTHKKRDSNAVNKTTLWAVLWTMTEEFCEAYENKFALLASQNSRTNPRHSTKKKGRHTCVCLPFFIILKGTYLSI